MKNFILKIATIYAGVILGYILACFFNELRDYSEYEYDYE